VVINNRNYTGIIDQILLGVLKMKKNIHKMMLVILSLSIILVSCAKNDTNSTQTSTQEDNSSAYSVVDDEDRTVKISDVPKTIVVMSDTAIGPIVQLGFADKVIGIDSKIQKNGSRIFSSLSHPEMLELPIVGSVKEPNFEKLIELNPDLIIIKSHGNEADLIQSKTGIPVVSTKTIDGFTYNYYELLGKVFKEEKRAKDLINFMDSKIALIQDKIKDIPIENRSTFFCSIYVKDRNYGNTFKNLTSLDLVGAKNVASTANNVNSWGLVTVSTEQILEWNPEYLILERPVNEEGATLEEYINNPIIKMCDAVRDNKYVYTYGPYSIPKDLPRILTESFYFCNILYPQLFSVDFVNKQIEEVNQYTYGLGLVYPVEK
jgi:iron complex transport system substrate-binding protein